ncbi:MAG: GNAT family N-acetyltransferase [Roseburia sp.]|nr:GNAT family N-acetyltransferase [Roseburia sp.]
MCKGIYTIIRIDEPDFGCEGRPEGRPAMDTMILRGEQGQEVTMQMEETRVWELGLDEGKDIILDEKGEISGLAERMKRLETKRLILRSWRMTDAWDMYAYASTDKVGPMAGWKPHEDIGETRQILRNMFVGADDVWALELKENHKVIGSVGLHRTKREAFICDRELGFVLSEEYWGLGLMPEAAERVIQYAFEELGAEKLIVLHSDFNMQSKRVIEKLGFFWLTRLEKYRKGYDGRKLNKEVYGMTRAQYRKESPDILTVQDVDYHIVKLLGKGKGGYSYLAWDGRKEYVVKQIHHEPCSYYAFGDKMEAEQRDYEKLRKIGVTLPKLLAVDVEKERILKEYIKGDTIYDLVLRDEMKAEYLEQMKRMCEQCYSAHINIDYFPTNFVVQDGVLYYIDYECNEYMDEWNFENWGVKYWSKTPEFLAYVEEHRGN